VKVKPALAGLALAFLALLGGSPPAAADPTSCDDCFRVRVGRPLIARRTGGDELDNMVPIVRLNNGRFRAFTANSTTYRVDAAVPWSLDTKRSTVLRKGARRSGAECGRWLNSVHKLNGIWFGFAHEERTCNYKNNAQTHKSMAVFTSSDEGRNWTARGSFILGQDAPHAGKQTGEGDCSIAKGHDGFLYAYCLRLSDWRTIVARAPATGPYPDQWRKWHAGSWTEPGKGGSADPLGNLGMASAYLEPLDSIVLVGARQGTGLVMSVSQDKVNFTTLSFPLVAADKGTWKRPSDDDLYAYTSMVDPQQGGNDLNNRFGLLTVYVAPGDSMSRRRLIYRDVDVEKLSFKPWDQVGTALTRWRHPSSGKRRVSTAPVVASGFREEKFLGYMLTAQPDGPEAVKIIECVGKSKSDDLMLAPEGDCGSTAYKRLRSSGWLLASATAETLPVYRCVNDKGRYHFASNDAQCEGLGRPEWLLGHALAH
jgi:hypothetical protein